MTFRLFLLCVIMVSSIAPARAAERLRAVATFSIVGDMVGRVAGDRVELATLVGPDADAHVFEPTPADARTIATAAVIFMNGLNFEPWMARLLESTKSRANRAVVSEGVMAIPLHDHAVDPHAWQNPRIATIYVRNIARALAAADPSNAVFYRANADAYLKELRALDSDIRGAFAKIPAAKRRVVTTHEAFDYFALAYHVELVAPLGASTEQQPSAKEVAAIISQIRREKITAVFLENIADPRLIQQIGRETGVKLGGKLYSDALSTTDGPAPTYIAMMRHNAKLLTENMSRGL